jgi:HK97 family phage major capsid protein
MYEVKADPLEASFDAVVAEENEAVTALRSQMEALRARVDNYTIAASRPALSGAQVKSVEHAAFVDQYLRKGVANGIELKSIAGTSDAAGGYAVPEVIDAAIDAALTAISPIRRVANVVKVGSAGYRKLITTGGFQSGWVAETAARPETTTPTFREFVPPSGELYANPAASQAMLDDVAFDLESWLAGEVATEFARAEGAAFVAGNGTNRPKGFTTYTTTNEVDSVRAWGSLQYVASGAAGAFAGANPQDRLVDLVQALRSPYRQGAVFAMNSATLAAIRKFKTTDGQFLWQPGLAEGRSDTLLGYPVIECEDMPDVAANSLSIAFGNFRAGYLIAERSETQIVRDPFTNKPYVHFYAVKRIGGGVVNSEAIKLMKFAAS